VRLFGRGERGTTTESTAPDSSSEGRDVCAAASGPAFSLTWMGHSSMQLSAHLDLVSGLCRRR
jgi:hypothetical protein